MIIMHNIMAQNTLGKLNKSNKSSGKSLERISSGLRISNSSDDAAGLAISEKMRGQIRGLDMAIRNSMDGVSLIQTAEGAMGSLHDNVQRMRELCIQASNDTLTSEDKSKVQEELNALKKEMNFISNNTEFNNINLLNRTKQTTTIPVHKTVIDDVTEVVTENVVQNIGESFSKDTNILLDSINSSGQEHISVDGKVIDFKLELIDKDTIKFDLQYKGTTIKSSEIKATLEPKVLSYKTFGGNSDDGANIVKKVKDDGFIIAGYSGNVYDDIKENAGSSDFLLIKLDENRERQWSKSLGTINKDLPHDVIPTSDGYIIVGETTPGENKTNGFIIKVDKNGDEQWRKQIAGTRNNPTSSIDDMASSVIETNDSYIIGGCLQSNIISDGKNTYNMDPNSYPRASIIKINKNDGNIQTIKFVDNDSVGFANRSELYDLKATKDGNFIGVGYYCNINAGSPYISTYVTKINNNGDVIWAKTYDAGSSSKGIKINETKDGGFIVIGDKSENSSGFENDDAFALKIDNTGNKIWDTTIGYKNWNYTNSHDLAHDIIQTSDGEYLAVVESVTDKAMIVKLDEGGNIKWKQSYGNKNIIDGVYADHFNSILQTENGGYVLVGEKRVNRYTPDLTFSEDAWFMELSKENSFPKVYSDSNITATIEGKTIKIPTMSIEFSDKPNLTAKKISMDVKYDKDTSITHNVTKKVAHDVIENVQLEEGDLILQVGANTNQIFKVDIDNMTPEALELPDPWPKVESRQDVEKSISKLDGCINKISSGRSKLGAQQNSLEHIISNLENSSENMAFAESRIRDLDVAKEIVEFTKNNIILQSAQVLLNQCNHSPEKVLELLR